MRSVSQRFSSHHRSSLIGLGALVVGLALAPAPRAQVSLAMPAEAMALEALGVRAGTQQRLQLPDVVTQAIVVPVVIDGQAVTLHLLPGSVRAPGFQLLVAGADGVPQPVPALPSAVVRGTVEQWPGSVVSGSMRNGRLRALVLPGDPALAGGDFAIDPLDADGEHLVYRVEDAEFDADFCGVGDEEGSWASGATIIGGSLGLIPLMTCDVAADSDVEFFQDLGSSVDAVVDHIEATLAGCTAIYEQQLGIELALVALVVRTEEPDPFFTYEGGTTLDELGEHWSVFQSQYDPDLVQLFTGKHYPGIVGLGSVGSVCHETNNVSLTESLYYSAFAKQVRVSNHEFGHNFGAGHCSTQPDCGIMCPAQCGPISTFGQQTVQTILMTKLTVACLELAEELALPEIFSTAPDSFPSGALGGFFVVNGVGLTTVIAVDVGTTQVSGSQVMVLNDETIMVAAPLPTALGPVRVVVHTAAGSSNPGQLVYGPTSPPLLQAPFAVSAGNPVKWMYGGDLGHTAVLLVSASGATMSAGSHDVLAETVVVHIGPLNAAALGRYTLPGAPASLAGLQLFSQVVMFTREGLDAASFVRTTNVLP